MCLIPKMAEKNAFGIAQDLPKPHDPAAKREIQANVDISLEQNTQKSWNFKEISAYGRELIAKCGVYETIRKECRDDFFWFIESVLNYVAEPNAQGIRQFDYAKARHFRWMKYLIEGRYPPTGDELSEIERFGSKSAINFSLATKNSKHNKKLILLPRIHGKTTVGNFAYNMWRLFKNPDLRILILSETRQNAVDMLSVIKDLYLKIDDSKNNDKFMAYYIMGQWRGDLWNEDAIKVKPRRVSLMAPTISTAGMESEIVSQHYDIIMCDDTVGAENTTTPDQIDKHKRKLASLTEVGDYDKSVWTQYIFLGTRWHYSDYYSVILDELTEIYDVLKLACWDDKTHEPLFPEKYTTEMLDEIRKEKLASPNPEEWANQWLNEPTDVETALFKRDQFQWYDNIDEILKGSFVGIFIDTSWSMNKWSDYIAMVPVAIGNFDYRYVLPYEYFKEDNPFYVANRLISLATPYYNKKILRVIACEEGAVYNALEPIMAKRCPWLRQKMIPLSIKNRSKDPRIMTLASLTTNKQLFLRRNMHDLIEQLVRFPRYSRRDLADALAYHLDIYPVQERVPSHPQASYPSTTEAFMRRQKVDDKKIENRRQYG